jgi:hypothetical protein
MVEKIYFYIRQDLVRHQEELINLTHYYTHKYRSKDSRLDINVGIFRASETDDIVQIYVADKFTRIREQITIRDKRVVDSNLIMKTYEPKDGDRDKVVCQRVISNE